MIDKALQILLHLYLLLLPLGPLLTSLPSLTLLQHMLFQNAIIEHRHTIKTWAEGWKYMSPMTYMYILTYIHILQICAKYSHHHKSIGKYKSKSQWDITLYLWEWPILKKKEHFYIITKTVNWFSSMENNM